ncbi:hypothetical protein [Yersinia vastinensis]|uniref:hypothetical protein n=1 Tax=Yersinia vastinensis TaxID=2890318 RepID=UPI00384C8F19
MMDITKSREEFHKWLEEVHGLYGEDIDWQPERNCYRIFGIHLAWCAWQASRESIEVELPKHCERYNWSDGVFNFKEDTIEACRTAGIQIKGESE